MSNPMEADRQSRIAELRTRLLGEADGERLAAFAEILFEHAAGEDLIEYDAGTLAAISREAFAFFRRRASEAAVRVGDLPGRDRKGRVHSSVEISTADRPFIFDSVLGELQASGHSVRLVVHPILDVRRDAAGEVQGFARAGGEPAGQVTRESFVHAHVSRIREDAVRAGLARQLTSLLGDVRVVTEDWPAMRARLREAIADLRRDHLPLDPALLDESLAFLQWLEEDNFVFLGARDYSYGEEGTTAEPPSSGGLGLLRDPSVEVLRRGADLVTLTPEIRAFLTSPDPLIVTKANVRTRVHRRDYMDFIGVKRVRDKRVTGETRIVGLFTSEAFTRPAEGIPLIRRKVAGILARARFDPLSHSGKALLHILEHYPRTELFQADEAELFRSAMAILQLEERPRVRALARRDRFDRFVSVLVFVPRDRYTSDLRERIGSRLAELYDGRVSAFFPDFSATHLTRVQFIVGRNPGAGPDPAQGDVEAEIRALIRSFDDALDAALNAAFPPEQAAELSRRYAGAFGSDYRAVFDAADALADIAVAERLEPGRIEAQFIGRDAAPAGEVALRLHHLGAPITLSRRVPLLENLGFAVIDERTFSIARPEGPPLFLHDMLLARPGGSAFDPDAAERLRQALIATWDDRAENDGFNALVLSAGLGWREAALLRTVGRYLRQTSLAYSLDYLWGALRRHPAIAALLVAQFHARFAPDVAGREEAERQAGREIETALHEVQSLDDDTILRAFRAVIGAAQRTDFYAPVAAGEDPSAITLKLDPGALPFVPAPRPYREIFVHSPQVEGLHLRFGPVARGGLRWSDRPQDFRTEVLGLVKAQQVKNAVIVPVGAKGGFVPMRLPSGSGSREAVFEAGRQAYVKFVDRLLSVTDNIDGDAVVPPAGVLRRDGDDPYFVVAADKGTATFSDTANSISLQRGFWLGDAFASGGSAGYDHKAMGITARGAWEAVKRHFREMDRDIQNELFTVAGVGDMSGDVFGNGMLLSPGIRLVAAFDHRDIFIDPDPDPAASLAERRRLFGLPRSSWQDYDRAMLSKGGGVFSRAEKEIVLSPEAREALRLEAGTARPAEIMAAILRAPVDLLWFGGIGTYVRGPDETDAEVGDKANDAIRISAAEIRAKVVGEGANLGMTPKARIAYGLKGGRCNSDAIDNSAGVNTSDVEVNIKIALAPALREGRLSEADRLAFLKEMTPEVAELVLRNNYLQPLAISLEERRGPANLPDQMLLMAELEKRGLLSREVEQLPSDAELEARAASGKGLTRAEIGTLLAFAKIALARDLLAGSVLDDPYLARELVRYFPEPMRERFAVDIAGHRLRREIIATQIANSMINRGGPTFLVTMRDRTGAAAAEVARAYAALRDSFALQGLHAEIDALDNRVAGQLQLDLYATVQEVTADRLGWFVRHLDPAAGLADAVARYGEALADLAASLPNVLPEATMAALRERRAALAAAGVPEALAERLAMLPQLAHAIDVIPIASRAGRPLADAAEAYFAVAERFGFGAVAAMADAVAPADYYEALALQKARDSLEAAHCELAQELLAHGGAPGDLEGLTQNGGARAAATAEQVARLVADRRPSAAKVTVAASLLAELARG